MGQFLLIPQEKLEDLEAKIQSICDSLEQGIRTPPKINGWISESEAQSLLGLKATSLWALRKSKQLRFSKVGAKIFYCLDSIEKLLKKNEK